jgi:O-Antigen ligase
MEASFVQQRRLPLTLRVTPAQRAAVAAWILGFAAPFYLALRGGGYDEVLRDEVGVALWWIVLTGALVGVLPRARPSRAQLVTFGALALFTAWTGLGALWSESAGQTVAELSRLSAYAAVLALTVIAVRAAGLRWVAGGLATAIAAIASLALLSRLHPGWFPANQTAELLPETRSRLNYPLDYWNGLAAFTALGIPLALHFATSARRLTLRALSAAALPAMAATVYLTFSRGGWLEVAVALIVYLALAPERLWRVATLTLGAGGAALLIAAIHERPAVDHGLLATVAGRQGGSELIVVALVVCAGVALLQAALVLLARSGLPRPSFVATLMRPRSWPWVALAITVILAFLLAGGPHALSEAWREFKNPSLHVAAGQSASEGRLTAISGNGRYQFWSAALGAFSSHPLGGIGAGTFQFWWAAHGSRYSYVINAHSLYVETLAETGLVGFVLLVLMLGSAVAGMARRWQRATWSQERALRAAVLGSTCAFLVAGVDWVWQIPAIPVALLLLAGAGNAGSADHVAPRDPAAYEPPRGVRIATVAAALIGTLVIVTPMAGAISLRQSESQASARSTTAALHDARTAASWQPYAASPLLQQALVLELAGNYAAAAHAASRAVGKAPTDWSAWLVLSRIEAERGRVAASLAAYRKAHSLDPHDPLFRTQ